LASKVDWEHVFSTLECDKSVKKVDWATPGYEGGISMLDSFIKNRLKQFDEDRNDPNKSMLSNLSPWYHFGQISVQRAIIEIKKYNSKFSKSVQGYMEGKFLLYIYFLCTKLLQNRM
jgi:deoxyribodipyrimidine photo-lyase